MDDINEKFEFLDSEEIDELKDKEETPSSKTICTECSHVMIRRVCDGIEYLTLIECPYSDVVNIQEYPVLECSNFKKTE